MPVAFVLGGADCLRKDYDRICEMVSPDTIIATNNAGRDFPGELPHWVTLHTEKMPMWIQQRRESGLPEAGQFWTSNVKTIPHEHTGLYNHVESWDGSSGLLAVSVALHLGYDRIVLCGVPLDKRAAHYDDPAPWMDAPRYRGAWIKHMDKMLGKVKSFSGWTYLKLGAPSMDWLDGRDRREVS
jgi:hypothetical protein